MCCQAGKFSLRASPTGEIHLSDCRVPAANLLPGSGGLKSPLMCLTQAREVRSLRFAASLDCLRACYLVFPSNAMPGYFVVVCAAGHSDLQPKRRY